jgi:hypothetical protein
MEARMPGLAVMTATTWIMVFTPCVNRLLYSHAL